MRLPKIITSADKNINKIETELGFDVSIELYIVPEIIYFSGHFPNAPVLPGVVQLEWVMHFASNYLEINKTNFIHIEQMKFSKAITPGVKLFLHLTLEKKVLKFKYYNEDAIYSIGKLKAKG